MPAPPLTYNFDGGTDGVQLATTDTGSGDQFQNVSKAADGTINYDSTHVHGGAHSLKITTVLSATTRFGWTGLGSITGNVYSRAYIWADANPSADWKISNTKTSTATATSQLSVDTTGKLHVLGVSLTLGIDSVNSIALGQFVRVEWLHNCAGDTYTWWLYNTPDAPLGSHTETKTYSAGALLGAHVDEYRYGVASTSAPTNFTCWFDDIAVSTVGQLGPTSSLALAPPPRPIPFQSQGRNL